MKFTKAVRHIVWVSMIAIILGSCSKSPNLNGHYHLISFNMDGKIGGVDITNNRVSWNGDSCAELKVYECSELRFKGNQLQIWPNPCYDFIETYKMKGETLVILDEANFEIMRLAPSPNCTIDHAMQAKQWLIEDSIRYSKTELFDD